MTENAQCADCPHSFPVSLEECPHCGAKAFPNVNASRLPREISSLGYRYDRVVADADARGASDRLQRFEEIVNEADAVMAVDFSVLRKLAESDSVVAATFYDRGEIDLSKGSHATAGDEWNAIRPAAETALFFDKPKRRIHFAALSPDSKGLTSYGNCSVTFRRELIQDRTSALIKNMLVFFKEKCEDYWRTERIPAGFRAVWDDRSRLAVTKCGMLVESTSDDDQLRSFLLTRGATSADDDFIELHIYGYISVRTMSKVVLTRPLRGVSKNILRAFEFKLDEHKVQWQDRSTTP
ncbi:MAG: hypothetical protein H8E37_09650 [Planctomycetes bacterium]|nr:hypothetical protein [Planctomycetota bacterium]